MNKFYIFSVIFHLFIGAIFLKSPIKEIPLVLKNRQIVKVSFNKNSTGSKNSNNSGAIQTTQESVETIPEPKIAKEIVTDTIEKSEKKIEIKKNIEKKITKNKKTVEPAKYKPIEKKTSEKNNSTESSIKDSLAGDNRFSLDSDGFYTASSSDGIEFEFLNVVNPSYPQLAKRMKYTKQVIIRTKFLVDIDGNIKNIEILDGLDKFGFREESMRALKQWKFKPITYQGKKIKVYFYKDFKFNVN